MPLTLIWAQDRDGAIGDRGTIPWHLPEDLAHFKELTAGATVLMGRATWDSLSPRFRPLPGRRNIVLTRQDDWSAPGAEVAHTLAEALDLAGPSRGESVWVIGGAQLYAETIGRADAIELTEIDLRSGGATRAPRLASPWMRTEPLEQLPWLTAANGLRYRFSRLERSRYC
jgi:dihydrofolate reductase